MLAISFPRPKVVVVGRPFRFSLAEDNAYGIFGLPPVIHAIAGTARIIVSRGPLLPRFSILFFFLPAFGFSLFRFGLFRRFPVLRL
jgi:hypothetical protein